MSATITTPDQMSQAIDQLGRVYQALAALRTEVEPANPEMFAVLAEGHVEEIRRLREELDQYSGAVSSAEHAAPIWLSVVGPGIEWQSAPTSVLTALLDAFRKGVQSVAELILTGDLAQRPTAMLKRSADFRIVALAPGSLRIGVALPDDEPGGASEAVARALDEYLQAAAWLAGDQAEQQLEALVPDERRRRLLLNGLSRLVPRERGQVESVELSGARVRHSNLPGRIILAREAKVRIQRALEQAPETLAESHEGDLREIDLDQRSFVLRNIEGPGHEGLAITCAFGDELLEVAKEALDKRVRVSGVRTLRDSRRTRPLAVSRIEIVEEQ